MLRRATVPPNSRSPNVGLKLHDYRKRAHQLAARRLEKSSFEGCPRQGSVTQRSVSGFRVRAYYVPARHAVVQDTLPVRARVLHVPKLKNPDCNRECATKIEPTRAGASVHDELVVFVRAT